MSRTSLQESLKEGGRGAAGDRGGLALRRGLVVATVAIALMLLVGAGLLTRSFTRLRGAGPRLPHRSPADLQRRPAVVPSIPTTPCAVPFFDRATQAIASVPGVTAAGATSVMPFTNNWSTSSFNVEGHVVEKGANMPWGDIRLVTPGFLPAIGAPLLKGRQFTDQDDANAPQVAIVDEEMVRRYWPEQDPIGKRITFNNFTDSVVQWIQVVGVVGHTMHEGLDAEKRMQVYFPLRQNGNRGMVYAVRTTGDPVCVMPGHPRGAEGRRPRRRDRQYHARWMNSSPPPPGPVASPWCCSRVFSALAAALAAIGLYGVMSYSVTQRSKELGVRLALGATPAGVQRLVMGQGMRLALFGVGFGLVAALMLTNTLRAFDNAATVKPAERLLFGVNANDPATFVSISLFLLGVTLLATWLPARRATSVDPVVALSDE